MLSYEEELQLSDLLVARRETMDRIREEDRRATRQEKSIIDKGHSAAVQIVEHYTPLIGKIAGSLSKKLPQTGAVTYDDLLSEGVIAAMSCCNSFNARGKDGHPGRRFSTYASPAISKYMRRYIARTSTPYKMNVSVVQNSLRWDAVRNEMEDKLGRIPTDDEIEAQVNISRDQVVDDILHYDRLVDIDDREAYNDPGSAQVVDLSSEEDACNAMLLDLLDAYVVEEFLEVYAAYLGLDQGYPRDIKETARETGNTKVATQGMVDSVTDILRHPKYRMGMASRLESAGWSATPEE